MHYNKLVRDKIPAIIAANGQQAHIQTLDEAAYQDALRQKLQEEVQEFLESGQPEELADILEVVYALAEQSALSAAELNALRQQKRETRGGFAKRLYLLSVQDAI